jgi:uncharacterized protein with HEPN domain
LVADETYDSYADDLKLQLALVKLIEIIGEAASKLSAEMRVSTPQIPWSDITGMRHRRVHDYRDIDLMLVWRTVQEDIPALLAELRPLLPPKDAGA